MSPYSLAIGLGSLMVLVGVVVLFASRGADAGKGMSLRWVFLLAGCCALGLGGALVLVGAGAIPV